MIKEACVGSIEEALLSEKNGAHRVELCDNLSEGGTTPSYGCIKQALAKMKIPVFIMIRPRGGDFHYSSEEIEVMKEDILMAKKLGAHGVVFGVLTEKKEIDFSLLKELISLSKPMNVTFHKAIDELERPWEVIPRLIECGVHRVLSSGTKDTALEGAYVLNKMIEAADGKIIVVAAGKVTAENLFFCSQEIHTTEFHGKKIV